MAKRIEPLLLRVLIEEARPESGKDIHALVLLANASPFELVVNARFQVNAASLPHQIALSLQRGRKTLAFLPKIRADPTAFDFQPLKPGAVIGRRVRLSHYFAIAKGAHRLVAAYRNQEDPPDRPGVPAWKGALEARTNFTAV